MKPMLATLCCLLALSTGSFAQTAPNPNQPDSTRFKGCLQGDSIKGFALLAATGDASGGDAKGQTMTYKVEAPLTISLAKHVNKIVEITGAVSQEAGKTGSMPAPVTDTVRGTGGAGGTGKPGENTAFYFANGTLTARSIREIAQTCAVRSAPDTDRKPQ
jgi:hypothetical protein